MSKIMLNGVQIGGNQVASLVAFDNTDTDLSATNVQSAITELWGGVSSGGTIRYNETDDTLEVLTSEGWVGILNCNLQQTTSLIPTMNSSSQYKQNILAMNTARAITDTSAIAPYSSFDGMLTSNSSSWGAACSDNTNTCGLGYKFDNKTRIRKTIFWITSGKAGIGIEVTLQYSDDNSMWLPAGTVNIQTTTSVTKWIIDSTETECHRYWRILLSSDVVLGITGRYATHIVELQFWGRSI